MMRAPTLTYLCALVTGPTDSMRAAKSARRRSLAAYIAAMQSMSPEHAAAVTEHHSSLIAEAAANRAYARELRDALAAIIDGRQP